MIKLVHLRIEASLNLAKHIGWGNSLLFCLECGLGIQRIYAFSKAEADWVSLICCCLKNLVDFQQVYNLVVSIMWKISIIQVWGFELFLVSLFTSSTRWVRRIYFGILQQSSLLMIHQFRKNSFNSEFFTAGTLFCYHHQTPAGLTFCNPIIIIIATIIIILKASSFKIAMVIIWPY